MVLAGLATSSVKTCSKPVSWLGCSALLFRLSESSALSQLEGLDEETSAEHFDGWLPGHEF